VPKVRLPESLLSDQGPRRPSAGNSTEVGEVAETQDDKRAGVRDAWLGCMSGYVVSSTTILVCGQLQASESIFDVDLIIMPYNPFKGGHWVCVWCLT
jgi:hypothetical protein